MRKRIACWIAGLLMLLIAGAQPLGDRPAGAGTQPRPNIILVLADDLDTVDLRLFPNIWTHLVRQGATFERFFVSNPWCCPSRATILRSQYVHSHGVLTNSAPEGGYAKFFDPGLEQSTIGTWLKAAGYRTALMGKYLNQYPGRTVPATHVPPGWDDWQVPVAHLYDEFGYTLNENGTLREYGFDPADYLSDVFAGKTRTFITEAGNRPFFLYLAPIAPHSPANYAPRHAGAFEGARAPRTPSFDQEDLSAEPWWLRSLPRFDAREIARIDERYRNRMRAMLGVDDLVGSLVRTLNETGRLSDTYFFFTSDNGFHQGSHRIPYGKTTPFEESVRVPMIVRGPGVRPGMTVRELTATVDLAQTFAALAGAKTPSFAEGRSLVPLLGGRRPPDWRRNVLVEFFRGPDAGPPVPGQVPPYRALRTRRYIYVEYSTGERQFYDLATDPFQLRNVVDDVPPEVLGPLRQRLAEMAACSGAACRTADAR
jgi:arylsulfatase A-like enzyme